MIEYMPKYKVDVELQYLSYILSKWYVKEMIKYMPKYKVDAVYPKKKYK